MRTTIKKISKLIRNKELLILLLIFLIASFLRFYNLNWDNYLLFHPDERNIANAATKIKFFSQMDPGFFAYGGLPIYLYSFIANILFYFTKDAVWVIDWGHIDLIGRFFSAFFSSITVVAVYFLAKNYFNKRIALFSSLITCFTVSLIQYAHYDVTESFITLIVILICLFSKKLFDKNKLATSLLMGIIAGLGIAAKTTSISFLIIPFLAVLFLLARKKSFFKTAVNFFTIIISAFITFMIFSPYTIIDWNKFVESMRYESGVASGSLIVPYTLQFNHSIPYLFQLSNLFWQMGPIALFAELGFIYLIFSSIKKKQINLLLFYVFPLVYFLYVGTWHTKFIRYMIPILPFLIISSIFLLFELRNKFRRFGNFLLFIMCLLSIIWALAFFSIYTREQTRISASKWIYSNIPFGKTILTEEWDDTLPVPLNSLGIGLYKDVNLSMYDQDNSMKTSYLANNLSKADYIIFNSRRLYGTLINLRQEYPITSKYYQYLFEGKLGYREIKQFASYPNILGIDINDDASEETFQVYEHPKVIIFKNEEKFSGDAISSILNE